MTDRKNEADALQVRGRTLRIMGFMTIELNRGNERMSPLTKVASTSHKHKNATL